MKSITLFTLLIISSLISLTSCKEATKAPEQEISQPTEVVAPNTPPSNPTQNIATPEPAQNAMGVWHYTCAQGCTGGAGSPSNCGTCGALLAHNAAYHGNPNNAPLAAPQMADAPSQNAAGIWHFSCGQGCAGGSGIAGNCTTCGNPLAHNNAFHQ